MIRDFRDFKDLLLCCLGWHDSGSSKKALELIDEYLAATAENQSHEQYWSTHNVQQALGFRIAFTQVVEPENALSAEERHLQYCLEQHRYWLSACTDSQAHLAIANFDARNPSAGHAHTREAVRLAGIQGELPRVVAAAAERARKEGVDSQDAAPNS